MLSTPAISRIWVAALLAAAFGVCATPARAWELDDWQLPAAAHKVAKQRNVEIKLDDGRVLRADLYRPADELGRRLPGPFPVLVGFTPFGKTIAGVRPTSGGNGLNLDLVQRGYIAAVVDVPGTGGSEGRFNLFDRAEAQAGKEVVDWAAALPGSSGSVGMLGLSYTAITQLFTAAEVGPGSPLKAIFPMAATADPYRDLFVSGGVLNAVSPLGLFFGYGVVRSFTPYQEFDRDFAKAAGLSYKNLDQMKRFEFAFASDMFRNGQRRYNGDFWQQRAPTRVLQQIADNGVAAFVLGGQYDVFQRGEPLLYSGLQNAAAGRPVGAPMAPGQAASGRFQLLTGPWNHGTIGAGVDLSALQLAWFDRWLKNVDNGIDRTATPLHVLEPGGARYSASSYPLADGHVERLHLRSGRRLTADPPVSEEPGETIAFSGLGDICSRSTEQYTAGALVALMKAAGCWPTQRKPSGGPAIATYSTEPLRDDLQLAGPIGLTLYAGSTHREALFAVTLEDVAPSGRSDDITGGAQLGTLRALAPDTSWPDGAGGFVKPDHPYTRESRLMIPRGLQRPVRYDIEVRPAFATVPAGHRLRLRVTTADFPHFVPLADLPLLFGGLSRVHHTPVAPSAISLSVR